MTPCNLEAERAVLGAILLSDETSLPQVLAQGLRPEDFYWEDNQRVFGAMISMYEDSRHVDPLTLGLFVEDRAAVDALAAAPFSVAHLTEYVRIVIDFAYRRRMLRVASEIERAAENGDMSELRVLIGNAVALLPKEGLRAVESREAA